MSSGLHNRVKERVKQIGRDKTCFYEDLYADLKKMMGYLLECGYVPLSFEKEHNLDHDFEEFRKIWKKYFRIPYLEMWGYYKYRCPEIYKLVYREWVNYLKRRLIQIRSLYLIEVIAGCICEEVAIDKGYLSSYNKDITEYVTKKVWPSQWIQDYNKKFSVARELEEK